MISNAELISLRYIVGHALSVLLQDEVTQCLQEDLLALAILWQRHNLGRLAVHGHQVLHGHLLGILVSLKVLALYLTADNLELLDTDEG